MAASGRLGRKTGRGWYDYSGDGPYRTDDPLPLTPGGADGRTVAIIGDGAVAVGLRERAAEAGFQVLEHPDDGAADLVVDADIIGEPNTGRERPPHLDVPLVIMCSDTSLAWEYEKEACGFFLLPPAAGWSLVELTRLPTTPEPVSEAVDDFFRCAGFHREWVGDAAGLVLGRIIHQLVNEAMFAIGEGVGTPDDVDAGVKLGLNHPRGPVEWGRLIGFHLVNFALGGLRDQTNEERYRSAPLLHRVAILGEAAFEGL
jgi:3-hydroxybutyryl-CoA dehydrogenase